MKNAQNTLTKLASVLVFIFFLASCNMNKSFVRPYPFPKEAKVATISVGKPDSTKVYFNGPGHEPTFVKQGDTLYKDIQFIGVFFKNKNGENLHGYVIKSRTAKPLNIHIVHFRGAANNFVINQFQAIEPLIKEGFTILVFDYAGFAFSEGYATRKDLLDDGAAAVDFMKNRFNGPNDKIVAYGQSFGGSLATAVSAKNQTKVDGLVSEGAFSSHKEMAAVGSGLGGRIFVKELYSAKRTVDNFKKPVLVIHSTEDEVTPYWMGEKIYESAKEPKKLLTIKGKHLEGPSLYCKEITEGIKTMFK